MQLEADTVVHLLRQLSITYLCSVVGQLRQIVGFELDTVQLVYTAQFLDFLLTLLLRQRVLPILITGKLLEQLLGSDSFPVFLFRTEFLWNGEERHNRRMVDVVHLHLVENLHGIGHRLRHILEHLPHLFLGLEPLLLGVKHTGRVVKILTC